MQENLLKLLLAISEGNSDGAADVVIQFSEKTEDFNQTEFRRGIVQIMASQQDQSLQQTNVGKSLLEVSRNAADNGLFVPSELTLLEMKEFVGGLPSRLDRIMDAIINQELQVTVKAVDAHNAVGGIQKIANRITAGILLASLILGASQLMRVQTSFRIFGYPGLAILCFLSAAAGGFWLVMSIFVQDHKGRQK